MISDDKPKEFSYNGNSMVKRDGVPISYTQEELKEYLRCMNDIEYFLENYVKIVSLDEGTVKFKMYDYQKRMIKHIDENRFSILLLPRQMGKSIVSCGYLLHHAIFNPDKTIAILANKAATAREMLGRITFMLENLPFFLQPGVKVLNKGNIAFSNNSEIIAASTSSSSIRGLSINVVFIDEMAFIQRSEEFFTSTYPVISSGKSTKVIVTSTPNGIANMFYKLWEGAVNGTSEFAPLKIEWWEHPNRDEKWKEETIANTSPEQFKQEFDIEFIGSSNTLIDSNALLGLTARDPKYRKGDVKIFEPAIPEHNYVILCDVGKGRGQDSSTITVIDTSTDPFQQVCTYKNNMVSPLVFPSIIDKVGRMYNEGLLLVENNDAGMVVCNQLYYELEYENMFVTSAVKSNGIGVTMTKKVKREGCSNLKDLIELGKLQIHDADTIVELSTFESRGSSYEAAQGAHDDLVMNLVLFGWYVDTPMFNEVEGVDLKDLLFKEKLESIERDLPFAGMFGDDDEEEVCW